MTKTTDFGFEEVPVEEKVRRVGQVFSSVASRYDIMNDLMSMGVHRLWKRYAVDLCAIRPGQVILDIAGGTGDLTRLLARKTGQSGQVTLVDINPDMLRNGRERLTNTGVVGNVDYVLANAEHLPFPENYADCITVAFGLRNMTDKPAALQSMFRVLKPGGRLVILEFSKPTSALLKSFYDVYSFKVLPQIGRCVAGDSDSYRYLVESIRKHPDQETLKAMIESCGFNDCEYFNLSNGIVAVHRAYKY